MSEFLSDPTVKCFKHGKAFLPEKCGECAALITLAERMKLLEDISKAYEDNDGRKLEELHKKVELQNIVDEELRDGRP